MAKDFWLNPPPVVAISGNQEYRRNLEVRKALNAAHLRDRRITEVDGEEPGVLDEVQMTSIMFAQKTLALVRNPDKADLAVFEAHQKAGDNHIVFLLFYEGKVRENSKFAKFLASLGDVHASFIAPPPWEEEEYALGFLQGEAKRRKKELPDKLAAGIIRLCGTDLGILSFEMLKISAYAEACGTRTLGPEHVRPMLSRLTAADVSPLINALADRRADRVMKSLSDLEKTHSGDPTMYVCAVAGGTVRQWLQALSLKMSGLPAEEAARVMGQKPFRFERMLLPPAQRWGEHRLVGLIRLFAETERAVKTGRISPWNLLQTRLIQACRTP